MAVVYGAAAVMRRSFFLALIVLLLLGGRTAHADAGDEARARALYEKGMAHFQLDEFDAAITLWLEAYRFKPAPELLYNVAQAHRLKSERALAFYRKYLALNPKAANRAEAERHIASLEQLLRDEPPPQLPPAKPPTPEVSKPPTPVASKPPTPVASKPPPPVPPLARPVAPPPVKLAPSSVAVSRPELTAAPVAPIARRADRSLVRKPWLWATVGTVAVVVAVGVGLGVGEKGAGAADTGATFGVARGN